ncbi:hypothetical protein MKZ38_000425 [Zalerion maritima]|uniref:P-loop containing nucleoside triphosphate hydrolase protein n=1 Tax=Zalerion maritima TaxID=339359 RepID=A0AAD5RZ36_9PEZI|nr:hypothetical protein MKZ38_000425 [Zalerion maritima]
MLCSLSERIMSTRPIFVATHPRSCSTAFERVFMTRKKDVNTVHEPFGDAFYWGPERWSERFMNDNSAREQSGYSKSTYKDVFDYIMSHDKDVSITSSRRNRSLLPCILRNLVTDKRSRRMDVQDGVTRMDPGKRLFLKDMAYHLLPPDQKQAHIAPSMKHAANGAEVDNPTMLPKETLKKFHFTFLIRHPRRSVPSYYRCTIPPLDKVTGFYHFMPNESGYDELRRLFDYLRENKIVGPAKAGEGKPTEEGEVTVTVVDADDLLDNPAGVIEAFCNEVGLSFTPEMLSWENESEEAKGQFEKWSGFHNDALGSSSLKPRTKAQQTPTPEAENEEWQAKYGEEAAKVIRDTVDANVADYEYLKKFALKVPPL